MPRSWSCTAVITVLLACQVAQGRDEHRAVNVLAPLAIAVFIDWYQLGVARWVLFVLWIALACTAAVAYFQALL